MCLGDAFSVAFILSWYTQDKVLQWHHPCCVWWAHCRLKEPKRPCWTCEAISHKYDLQRNDKEERSSRLRQKIHLPWLHHDYVNLVRSKGVDIWQTITGLCTDVASQDIFRIAAWLFVIGWQVKSFKPESKVDFFFGWKCHCISLFLTFSFFSFSVRDLFQNRFLVRCVVTHLCWEMGLFTGANDVPVVKVFAL